METSEKLTHGLTSSEVKLSRKAYGENKLSYKKENRFLSLLKSICGEPMVLLLLAASVLYFISGEYSDGVFLSIAILLIITISLYQEGRSRNALQSLEEITQPLCKVIRDSNERQIRSEEIVVGDILILEEGSLVVADGKILQSNDFSVNESILTGESMAVFKAKESEDNMVFSGTVIVSGMAIIEVTAIGNATRVGVIGKSLQDIKEEKTPLERQINNFVKKMVIAGLLIFLMVWVVNFLRTASIIDSLLLALTLAMSILPEEIPVAFTTFMALGAWRLMKTGVIVKQMKTVETLGSATVICTDKTGTITRNKMEVAAFYLPLKDTIKEPSADKGEEELMQLLDTAMWASEPVPFDPMDIALHDAYSKNTPHDRRTEFKMIHEYPLSGKPPMMTHIYEDNTGRRIVACKGAPEAIIAVSGLSESASSSITKALNILAGKGYRVLGVGKGAISGDSFPETQQEIPFEFIGLVAFYDPPKDNIPLVLESFYKAGLNVKIITGDNAITTSAIAEQIGFRGYEKSITGEALMKLDEKELYNAAKEINVFSRMFPEAKLRIVNALKANGEIVAMVGDGVNDGPALKAAHIGIAMGKKGTEVAKEAASLIVADDDLARMTDAVAMGRKIYANLKKAIQYIISIHIPIILIVFIPLVLGWLYPSIFSPLHVILLELIMGPTCSIIYENEPAEKNIMLASPRPFTTTFFKARELATSIVQGLLITTGTLLAYQLAIGQDLGEEGVRSMVFITLITANIFLTLVNRSFYYSVLETMRYKNALVGYIISLTIVITFLLFFVPFLRSLFGFMAITFLQFLICVGLGAVSVLWYELIKVLKRSIKC